MVDERVIFRGEKEREKGRGGKGRGKRAGRDGLGNGRHASFTVTLSGSAHSQVGHTVLFVLFGDPAHSRQPLSLACPFLPLFVIVSCHASERLACSTLPFPLHLWYRADSGHPAHDLLCIVSLGGQMGVIWSGNDGREGRIERLRGVIGGE
jgi:hypothetical protein